MGRSKRHGRRPHKARNVCQVKGAAFTTWDAAMAVVATTPGAERPYRGTCCGYYHITRETQDEYAQRVAEFTPERRVKLPWEGDTVDHETETSWEANDESGTQSRVRESDAGTAQVQRGRFPGLTPSPATLARRLQACRRPEES